jgi:hypothetical protein
VLGDWEFELSRRNERNEAVLSITAYLRKTIGRKTIGYARPSFAPDSAVIGFWSRGGRNLAKRPRTMANAMTGSVGVTIAPRRKQPQVGKVSPSSATEKADTTRKVTRSTGPTM